MNQRKVRNLRYIRRFNFHHCNSYETVAEHSFFVGILAAELAADLKFSAKEQALIMKSALLHDIEESVIGDVGFLIRRELSMAKLEKLVENELDVNLPDVHVVVEFADCFELKMYLEEERRSGNLSLLDIERETFFRLRHMDLGNDRIQDDWLNKLEPVEEKALPVELTHSGGDW